MTDNTRGKVGLDPKVESPVSDLAMELGIQHTPYEHERITKVESDDTDPFIKAERALMSNALDIDDIDMFKTVTDEAGRGSQIINPTYNPVQLHVVAHQNNTLLQAVTAMEVNIDGTGYEIERRDGNDSTETDETLIKNEIRPFFDEPWPETSFVTIRRQLRRDLEITGNGYLEVLRDASGEISFLKRLDAKLTRLLKLDRAVPVDVEVQRGTKTKKLRMMKRERRYAQLVGKKLIYFKEFGASRDLNKITGMWAGQDAAGNDIPMTEENKATEIIHFTVAEDVITPYGVPRWINQTPSAIGSRKAEEFNVEFFNHGGLPPAAIFIAGGALTSQSRDAITSWMGGKASLKQRAVLVEIMSAGGDINSSNNVKVTTERFGDSRQDDSMFENYDKRCSLRVRGAFRLPPILVGLTEDYTRATAYVSTMVAESQIFQPERDEFDEIINRKIMAKLWPDYVYRSLPVSINDIEEQIKALTLVEPHVKPDNLVSQVEEVAHLELQAKDDEDFEQEVQRVELEETARARSRSVNTRDEGGDGGASKEPGN